MPLKKYRQYSKRKGVCRSIAEMKVFDDLTARGIPFAYEQETLTYITPAVTHKYVPDFRIGDIFVEYKGWFKPEDRHKMLLVLAQNPTLDIRMLFMKDSKLYKDSKERYSDWCERYGIKYAIGAVVPQEWVDEAFPKMKKKKKGK